MTVTSIGARFIAGTGTMATGKTTGTHLPHIGIDIPPVDRLLRRPENAWLDLLSQRRFCSAIFQKCPNSAGSFVVSIEVKRKNQANPK